MKKILLVIIGMAFAFNVNASTIPEGAVVKTANNPDVYIVKYKNGKQYKRLVLNPQVFESYGHLRWEDILTITQSDMTSFIESNLVRVDGQNDVYQLAPDGDTGKKSLITSTTGYDLDSAYTINSVDFSNYIMGSIVNESPTPTPTSNTVFCNGVNYSKCESGFNFVCPQIGTASCQQANTTLCNGTLYTQCPTGEDFICPAIGKAYCQNSQQEIDTQTSEDVAELQRLTEETQRITKATEALQQLTVLTTEANNELNILYQQMENKKAAIEAESEKVQSMRSMLARQAKLTDEYNAMVGPYNTKLERYNKMLAMRYVIEDYKNNIYISVEDRAFLGSLGINL